MSTVALLLERLAQSGGVLIADGGRYRLEAATGRPGSVCFSVQEVVGHAGQITLGEGFSHDGRLVFEHHTLPEHEVERIIAALLQPQPELAAIA